MGKLRSTKRLSATSQSSSKSVDVKARKRIEELYELTDEIISAYNEINDKYVHHIYQKYQRLKERHRKLQQQLNKHHCQGCQCLGRLDDEIVSNSSSDEDGSIRNESLPSSTTNSAAKQREVNPLIISDVEETQNFDTDDSRFCKNFNGHDPEKMSVGKNSIRSKLSNDDNESEQDNNDEVDEAVEPGVLPLKLRMIIERKATKNNNAKGYLLKIPNYPTLCEYLCDRSHLSFDHRPGEEVLRPFVTNHLGVNASKDAKVRMRIRDEFREIHRSYLRTFMNDPHGLHKSTKPKTIPSLLMKKSPL